MTPPPAPAATEAIAVPRLGSKRKWSDRVGDPVLLGVSGIAALAGVVVIALIVIEVVHLAQPAISEFGLGFITTNDWNPVTLKFGAASFLYGTAVTSAIALFIATPLSIAIALFLTEMAPGMLRRPVATLVDLLAAIPTVVLGLWGILVLGPVMVNTIEPALKSALGFLPIFSGDPSAFGLLTAALILTIMAVPIVTSITREVFETVPGDLKEGAYALGATRWEMVKIVMLPYAKPGIVGAVILGLGRAIGEAIAVAQVVGGSVGIHASIFGPGDTLAARIASEFQGSPSALQKSSLAYLAVILLVFSLVVNVVARMIISRTSVNRNA